MDTTHSFPVAGVCPGATCVSNLANSKREAGNIAFYVTDGVRNCDAQCAVLMNTTLTSSQMYAAEVNTALTSCTNNATDCSTTTATAGATASNLYSTYHSTTYPICTCPVALWNIGGAMGSYSESARVTEDDCKSSPSPGGRCLSSVHSLNGLYLGTVAKQMTEANVTCAAAVMPAGCEAAAADAWATLQYGRIYLKEANVACGTGDGYNHSQCMGNLTAFNDYQHVNSKQVHMAQIACNATA